MLCKPVLVYPRTKSSRHKPSRSDRAAVVVYLALKFLRLRFLLEVLLKSARAGGQGGVFWWTKSELPSKDPGRVLLDPAAHAQTLVQQHSTHDDSSPDPHPPGGSSEPAHSALPRRTLLGQRRTDGRSSSAARDRSGSCTLLYRLFVSRTSFREALLSRRTRSNDRRRERSPLLPFDLVHPHLPPPNLLWPQIPHPLLAPPDLAPPLHRRRSLGLLHPHGGG